VNKSPDSPSSSGILQPEDWADPLLDLSVHQSGERRIEYWREIILRLFADVQISAIPRHDFFGKVLSQRFSDLRLSVISASEQSVDRRFREARSDYEDRYFAVLMLQGKQIIEQSGSHAILEVGDMAIYDATRPHSLRFEGQWQEVVFSISRPILNNLLVNAEDRVATSLAVSQGVGNVLSSYLGALGRQIGQLSADEMTRLADPAISMLAMTLGGINGSIGDSPHLRSGTLLRVKRYVNTHLHDPDLDAAMIASASGLSARYINKLFAAEGTSLIRYVLLKRLDRCAHSLSGTGGARTVDSIADIALRWGFNDMSHFSRAFKKRFGVTPREWRKEGVPKR